MAQAASREIPTSGPAAPVVERVQQMMDALFSLNSGSSAPANPVRGMWWADTSSTPNLLKMYNGSDWVIIARLADADPWALQPIGVPFPMMFGNTLLPPVNNPQYRYVMLTAGQTGSGAYNEGCLGSEVVSGSAPVITASAIVTLADSPLLGVTVPLINTEQSFIRPGTSSSQALQDSANASHSHDGTAVSAGAHTHTGSALSAGTHDHNIPSSNFGGSTTPRKARSDVDSSSGGGVRTDDAGAHTHTLSINSNGAHTHTLSISNDGTTEARPRNRAWRHYMRIR